MALVVRIVFRLLDSLTANEQGFTIAKVVDIGDVHTILLCLGMRNGERRYWLCRQMVFMAMQVRSLESTLQMNASVRKYWARLT